MPKPQLEIELTTLDKVLELLAMLAIVAMCLLIIFHYSELPDRIPHHFNAAGEPDAWGGKLFLLGIPTGAIVLYYLLRLIAQYPNLGNFPVKITEENAERQFLLVIRMVRALNLVIQLLLLCILIWIIRVGLGKSVFPANYLVFTLVIAILGVVGLYTYAALRNR